ncbi:hypothetical protein [Acidovorax delafieldii]|uniref:hypothetical protein n=1 Tax=Acidovorax delafieldii TaxID=47920 RepID=UPI003ED12112
MNPTFSDWAKLRAEFVNVEAEPLTAVQWSSLKAEFEEAKSAWERSAAKLAKRRNLCIAIMATSFTLLGLELVMQDDHRWAALFFGLNLIPITWFIQGRVAGSSLPYDLFFAADDSFGDIPLQFYDVLMEFAEEDPATGIFVQRVLRQYREPNVEEFRAIKRRHEKLKEGQIAEQRTSRSLLAKRYFQLPVKSPHAPD